MPIHHAFQILLISALLLPLHGQSDFSWDGEPETPNAQYGPANAVWSSESLTWLPGNTTSGFTPVAWVNGLTHNAQFKSGTNSGSFPAPEIFTLTLGEHIVTAKIDIGGSFYSSMVVTDGGSDFTLTAPILAPNGKSLTMDVVLVGSNGLQKLNGGDLYLNRANLYTGSTNLNQGNTIVNHAQAFSSSTVVINAASKLKLNAGINNAIQFNSTATAGTIELNGSMDLGGNLTLVKEGSIRQVVVGSAQTLTGNVNLGAKLTIQGGNTTLTGTISGAHNLEFTGGTNRIEGSSNNTFTGHTLLQSGSLYLAKTSGNAVGGDLTIKNGFLQWSSANQIADQATLTIEAGSINTLNRSETIKNLNFLSATSGVSIFSGLNVTDTFTLVTSHVHDLVNSSGSFTAHRSVLSGGATLKLGANGGPSTYNIGAGGASFDHITLQIGSNGAEGAGVVKFNGNFTGTGSNQFTALNRIGVRSLDLNAGARTFDIQSGVTSVQGLVSMDNGSVIKTGAGILSFNTAYNTYAGGTQIVEGTILANNGIASSPGSATGSGAVTVETQGSLGGHGTIEGVVTIKGHLRPGNDSAKTNFGFGQLHLLNGLSFEDQASLWLEFGAASANRVDLIENPELLLSNPGAVTLQDHVLTTHLSLSEDLIIYVDLSAVTVAQGDVFDLLDFASLSLNGFDAASNIHILGNPLGFGFDYSKFQEFGVIIAVPEPNRSLLAMTCVTLLALRRRRI